MKQLSSSLSSYPPSRQRRSPSTTHSLETNPASTSQTNQAIHLPIHANPKSDPQNLPTPTRLNDRIKDPLPHPRLTAPLTKNHAPPRPHAQPPTEKCYPPPCRKYPSIWRAPTPKQGFRLSALRPMTCLRKMVTDGMRLSFRSGIDGVGASMVL